MTERQAVEELTKITEIDCKKDYKELLQEQKNNGTQELYYHTTEGVLTELNISFDNTIGFYVRQIKNGIKIMELLDLYNRCLKAGYITTGEEGDYAIEREGNTLYLLFQWSNGKTDWKNNFDFPAIPYKDMGITWHCHRGFLKVWKSIEPYLKGVIMDEEIKHITIVGYSHGAAVAILCHEYVWFNRPDLRNELEGYGFGCPRCFWGVMKEELKERWKNFHPIGNKCDIVTHVPPVLLGFRHVNKVIKIGKGVKFAVRPTKIRCVDAHVPDNYIKSLKEGDL